MTATLETPSPGILPAPREAPRATWTTATTLTQLDDLAGRWCACPAAANPMQSFAWIRAAMASLAVGHKVQIIALIEDERLLAAAPLIKAEGASWELLNHYQLYEPADLIFVDDAAASALAHELARRGLPLRFERLPADSPTLAAVARAYASRGCVVQRPKPSYPYIPLDDGWSTPEGRLSPRRRGDLRRARRHAEEHGPVSCQIAASSARDVDPLLDELFRVEALSWKGEHGTALARDAGRADFYRRLARQAADEGSLRLGFLRFGAEVAAVQMSLVQANALWVLKIGYDPRFHRASPGILLMVEQIKAAVAAGLACYELLGTVEPWIQVWTEHERRCVSLHAYPANFAGASAMLRDVTRGLARRTKRISPQTFLGKLTCKR